MSPQQLDTILAALCFYQQAGMANPDKRPRLIDQIATEHGPALDDAGINALSEGLNCGTLAAALPARLIIHVERGAVTQLTSDTPVACIVADFDIAGADLAAVTSFPADSAPCAPHSQTAAVDPDRTQKVFAAFETWRFTPPA